MPVSSELWIFLWSICGGIVLGFVFDIFRIKRRIIKTGIILITIEDLLFWTFAAIIFFLTLYLSNEGQMRGFTIIGAILGAVFYMSAISPIVLKISVTVIDAVIKGFIFFLKVISWPVIFMIKLLKPIVIFANKGMSSTSQKCINSVRKGSKSISKKILTRARNIKRKKSIKNNKSV